MRRAGDYDMAHDCSTTRQSIMQVRERLDQSSAAIPDNGRSHLLKMTYGGRTAGPQQAHNRTGEQKILSDFSVSLFSPK